MPSVDSEPANFSWRSFLSWFLDFIVPRSNGNFSSIHGYLTNKEIQQLTPKYLPIHKDWVETVDKILICSSYKDDLVNNLIHRAKFSSEIAICQDLARLIQSKSEELILPDLIGYVPADPIREKQRGYHLPQIIAKELAHNLGVNCTQLLQKTKSTKPQTKLHKKDRLNNLKGVFEINTETLKEFNSDFKGTIWLIDDIITTGTTIISAAKIIKGNYPKSTIIGLAVAG